MSKTILRISAHRDGYRRAAVEHFKVPTDHPAGSFSDEQVAQLKADPLLTVIEVGAGGGKAKPTEGGGAAMPIEGAGDGKPDGDTGGGDGDSGAGGGAGPSEDAGAGDGKPSGDTGAGKSTSDGKKKKAKK